MTFIEILQSYKDRGLLVCQFHPTLPLIIWNYSTRVQYEALWDEITLQARALVTDTDGNIISRGFSKFFNIEEDRHEATDDFEIFEKLDGQYIGCFWYNGKMVVNSKGSFTSPYAIEAKRILEEKYWNFKNIPLRGVSYCFELIGFEQIVVSYTEVDLILTGVFDIHGNDLFRNFVNEFNLETPIVNRFIGLDWKSIKQLNWQNSEGFVVRFSNGSRCKIKFEDYLKLHRQMTNLSTTGIWEALSEGNPVSSILNDVPDEFYQKVHQYEIELKIAFGFIKNQCLADYLNISLEILKSHPDYINVEQNLHYFRSEYAELARQKYYPSILFSMLDGKDCSKQIWQLIKPKFEKI